MIAFTFFVGNYSHYGCARIRDGAFIIAEKLLENDARNNLICENAVGALSICQNLPARPLPAVMIISLLKKITQSVQSIHKKTLLEKAYFIVKMAGPAMVQPISFEQPSQPQ